MVDEHNLTAQPMPQSPGASRRSRSPGSRLRGCGCIVFVLALFASPFIAASVTSGTLHQILVVIAGLDALFLLIIPFIVLASSREGRDNLGDGIFSTILESLFSRF
ncbi:MAG: hypothetical protein H0X24_02210 [Ktedonobacterales bacterium]|nr:hypothetical protein [Ktedonobacterales bacterium]